MVVKAGPTYGKAANRPASGETTLMKLSVMLITYNQDQFIGKALESVLAQRVNFDYEIVIGEDCSTDGTRAVIMDFHRRYPGRIVPLLRDQNMGAMRNLEATLSSCQGQYVALIEGDDYWTCDDKLQRQVDFLETHHDSALCCHRVQVLDEMGTGRKGVFPFAIAGSYAIEDLLKENFVMTCTAVMRRSLVGPLPDWFSEMKLGDWPLFALVARHGKIELMDEVMAAYRVHSGGIWSSRPPISQLCEVTRMLLALDKHLGFQYTRTIRRTLARSYFEMACHARRGGSRMETGKHFVNCIRNGGWWFPGSRRTLAALAAYSLIGSWYKVFSREKAASRS
jgi:glycosyltransferase involved in cell wall biosynthesis